MQLDFAHDTKELANYTPKPQKVAHLFCRKNKNESIYLCSVFIGQIDNKLLVVNRYGPTELFDEFLKNTNLETTYSKFLSFLKNLESTNSFEANREQLQKDLNMVFELKIVDKTVIHALDFADTEEFNREPKNSNTSINNIIDSLQ